MPIFTRNVSSRWHQEVPGTRWFRADLHIHTLDDHPNGNLRRPPGLAGEATSVETQTHYARAFLRAAITNRIEVLGITPHAVRSGTEDSTSATWRIVDEWNTGNDDDGTPFRDKIYAVFPGFEPSLSDGAEGIHLLFLFDPEVGREQYLRAFDVVMNGVSPYQGGNLRNTTNDSEAVFARLSELHASVGGDWKYICLAPHAFSERGLFRLRSQILQIFPHEHLFALELGDNQLPEDAHANRPWLSDGMERFRHCFFHGSDAYEVTSIGSRFTMVKLGSPRIESLRQALLAPDSRMRLAYRRADDGTLMTLPDLPDPLSLSRPWLRRIAVRGGTSFFSPPTGGPEPAHPTFELSPDLTCIIGARMSGKSTLLDGLRLHSGSNMPSEATVLRDVEGRARNRFLSGGALCELDICGPIAPTEALNIRWPARFFTQRELQSAVRDQDSRRRLLYRLGSDTQEELSQLDREISQLDADINGRLSTIDATRETFVVAAQEFQNVERARDALARFRDAGSDELASAQGDEGRITAARENIAGQLEAIATLLRASRTFSLPELSEDEIKAALSPGNGAAASRILRRYRASTRLSRILGNHLQALMGNAESVATNLVETRWADVQRRLIEAGGTAEELNQFEALTEAAAAFELRKATLARAKSAYVAELRGFSELLQQRDRKVARRREFMGSLSASITEKFQGRIRLTILENGVVDKLDEWVRSLRNTGVTRWWNERSRQDPILWPEILRTALRQHSRGEVSADAVTLRTLGMSAQVAESYSAAVGEREKLQLAALRSEDRFHIDLRVSDEPERFKEMGALSGGAQVSVLLSLILESEDSTPLVIDQPEDEIDKAFLFDTVLPALRRLKGRRQVILATHDANIVVNGDADQVIQLEAVADAGHISNQGVIEFSVVRDAIVTTLDGGKDAFALRQSKYGF